MRVESERGFVLHLIPYRETSLLVDIFTRNFGRVRCVARGFRKPNKKGISRALFPYTEYLFNWQGRGELKTLNRADVMQAPVLLQQESLFVGLYINEILYRLLHEHDAHESLYQSYSELLLGLAQAGVDEQSLRLFEMYMLDELGYGLVLDSEAENGTPVSREGVYQYIPEHGLRQVNPQSTAADIGLKGADIIAISQGDFSQTSTMRTAKRLTRQVIDFYLDGRQLNSRELYRQHKQNKQPQPADKAALSGGD